MKLLPAFLLGALLSGAAVFFFVKQRDLPAQSGSAGLSVAVAAEPVARRLAQTGEDISSRLAAFAREVERDQLFSLRLIVENYPSAPEVVNKAVSFIKPMGFSLLDITDSAFTVISCGNFPASAGNGSAAKMERLSDTPAVIADRVMGKEVITFQARHTFRIAETLVFHVAGGIIIDEQWLEKLSPREGVRVLFKQGSVVLGKGSVKTISGVVDRKVIVNDREYDAVELPLPVADGEEAASLIVVMDPHGG